MNEKKIALIAVGLKEPVSEVRAALERGEGEICWRRLYGDPDCGCPTCMREFPGPIRIE